jgi:hypothetical protein
MIESISELRPFDLSENSKIEMHGSALMNLFYKDMTVKETAALLGHTRQPVLYAIGACNRASWRICRMA